MRLACGADHPFDQAVGPGRSAEILALDGLPTDFAHRGAGQYRQPAGGCKKYLPLKTLGYFVHGTAIGYNGLHVAPRCRHYGEESQPIEGEPCPAEEAS